MHYKTTPQQQAFLDLVLHSSASSIRLDAVAGSGKTTTLRQAGGLLPADEVTIALAFNKLTADTMRETFPDHITCRTFNSLGSFVWSKAKGRIKLSNRKMYDITQTLCAEQGLSGWASIQALALKLKSDGVIPIHYEDKVAPCLAPRILDIVGARDLASHHDIVVTDEEIQAAFEVLRRSISQALTTCIDFDDQIYMSTYFAHERYWNPYDNILVDEAQDLSPMQHDFLVRMGAADVTSGLPRDKPASPPARLIIVGDEHQAIYGWRGAMSDSLDQLETRFALVSLPLSVSFRCPPEIVAEAQQYVPHITAWEGKASGSVAHLGKNWTFDDLPESSVVLCRNNAPLFTLAFQLLAANRPAFFSGKDLSYTLVKTIKLLPTGPLEQVLASTARELIGLAEARGKPEIAAKLEDTYDTLEIVRDLSGATTKQDLLVALAHLMRQEYSEDAVELSTIHRAKGKEWPTVTILAPQLMPSKWAIKAQEEGKACATWMLEQERNLAYVAVTRSLNRLQYIDQKPKEEKK